MKSAVRIAVVAGTISIAACGSSRAPESVPRGELLAPGIALASFDSLWQIVSDTYVDTAFVARRWVRVSDSLRPRALSITHRGELDRLLGETLNTIPDSHFYIIPAGVAHSDSAPKTDGRGATGMSVRISAGKAVVWRVASGSPAELADIKPGQVVSRIGSRDTESLLSKVSALPEQARPRALSQLLHSLNGALTPPVGDPVVVETVSANNRRTSRLVASAAEGRVIQYANLPPIASQVKWSRIAGQSGCVGTIAFNIWLPALVQDLANAVDSVSHCRGIVVDLRGNPGGLGAMVMRFGGYFVDSVKSLGTMRTRVTSLKFVINPQRSRDDGSQMAPFTGPLAILIDPMTASTSEIFAAGMQRIGRARVFGERSAGAALPALTNRLPSGDVFVHAVADFLDPNGNRIEGAGAVPDVDVPLSVEALRQGRDGAMDEAVRWIGGQAGSR